MQFIIGLAAKAPRRRPQLTSNVRHHQDRDRIATMRTLATSIVLCAICGSFSASADAQAPASSGLEEPQFNVTSSIRSSLPEPPHGFTWQQFKNTLILHPNGWNQRALEPTPDSKGMLVYAASPEKFSESKPFEMGFTVQIISEPMARQSIAASKAALLFLKTILDAHKREDFQLLDKRSAGDAQQFVARYRDAPTGQTPIIVHKFIIANDAADSVHVVTFEAPEASWQENWARYGTPVLGKLVVVPNMPSR